MKLDYLKIGRYSINPVSIAFIEWDVPEWVMEGSSDKTSVRIHFLVPPPESPSLAARMVGRAIEPLFYLEFDSDSEEAKALKNYLE